jgi:SAM-dependent methyltransferase
MSSNSLVLNLGSGKDWREDCINADIQRRVKSDWCLDIQDVHWGELLVTRKGDFRVKEEMFDVILANDILEHVPDLVKAMTNCKDLLKVGGEMRINVPYDLSYGAWQDPTHVRAFNEKSWLYYTDWHWYLGWEDRFFVKHLEFTLSSVGESLKLPQDEILRTPRAVDSMYVILQKGKK